MFFHTVLGKGGIFMDFLALFLIFYYNFRGINKEIVMSGLVQELKGYRLTTLEVTYRMPDYKNILQTFVWQLFDIAPRFPEVKKFLDFWERELVEAPIHSVRLASASLIGPREFRIAKTVLTLPDTHRIH